MATVAQGQLAGQLANGVVALQTFVTALQAAVAANQTVYSITIGIQGQPQSLTFQEGLSASDSAALMNELITLANGLEAEWTGQLAGI